MEGGKSVEMSRMRQLKEQACGACMSEHWLDCCAPGSSCILFALKWLSRDLSHVEWGVNVNAVHNVPSIGLDLNP